MADAATVVTMVAASDYSWVAPTILAAAAFVGSLASLIVSIRTGKAVDGKMTELLHVATGKASAEATIAEKAAEAGRQGAAALATQGQLQSQAPSPTVATTNTSTTSNIPATTGDDIKGTVELKGVVK